MNKVYTLNNKYIYKPFTLFKKHKIIPGKHKKNIDFIQIETCNRCNLQCFSCGRSNRVNETKKDLTLKNFKKIIDQLPHLKQLDLSVVGEPLLNNRLPDIIKYATKKRIQTTINTNGTLFKSRLLPILKAGLGRLHISIDAATPELFEEIRKGAQFNVVLNNIKYAIELVKKNNFKTVITFNATVSHKNYREIPKIVRLAAKLGVKEVTVEGIHQWGLNKIDKKISFFRINKREVMPVIKNAIKIAIKNKINLSLPPIDRLGEEDNLKNYLCFWPWDSLTILANGDVVPCCIGVIPSVIFGNAFKQPLLKIWNNKKYQEFRELFMNGKLNEACSTCQMLLSFGIKRKSLSYLKRKINGQKKINQ